MKALGIVSAAVLMIATAAFAEEPEGDQSATQEKRVCKTKKVTGSLTRVRRTCLTESQWRRLTEVNQRNMDTLTRDANQVECLRSRSTQGGACANYNVGGGMPASPTGGF